MNNAKRQAAMAAWAESSRQQQASRDAAKAAAAGPAPAPEALAEAMQEGRKGGPAKAQLFAEAFKGEQPKPQHFTSVAAGNPAEQQARQLFPEVFAASGGGEQPQAEQAPEPPPEAPKQPAAAAQDQPPPQSTRELFERLEARVQAATAPLTPSPEAQVRRSFRELPGSQRDAIAARIEAEDFHRGYFSKYADQPDYVATLVSAGLVRRFRDAQRLDANYQPGDLLRALWGE